MHKSAKDSRAYLSFIKHRDKALETINTKALQKINDQLRKVFTRVLEMISYRYSNIPQESLSTTRARDALNNIHKAIQEEFDQAAHAITAIQKEMMRSAYVIAKAGEGQAIANATGEEKKIDIHQHEIKNAVDKTSEGHDIYDRNALALSRIARDIMDAIETGRIRKEETKLVLNRVIKTLPSSRKVRRPKKILKAIQEAEKTPKEPVNLLLNVSDEEWDSAVKSYVDEYVPKYRGPEDVVDVATAGEPDLEEWYAWEGERDTVNNFVQAVRDGTNEAAKENGITDFVFVAVMDDKTDECCAIRDGKLLSELEANPPDDEGVCEGNIPPLHFNCRCVLSPYLSDTPDLEPSNEEDFNQWLTT